MELPGRRFVHSMFHIRLSANICIECINETLFPEYVVTHITRMSIECNERSWVHAAAAAAQDTIADKTIFLCF